MVKTDTLKIATLVAAISVIAIVAGAGFAEARERGDFLRGIDFETLDVDGSGEITEADIRLLRENRFAEMDANGDGVITSDEFSEHSAVRARERAATMFERLDADGDGEVSRDALEARSGGSGMQARLIARADTNDSGGVDADEFDAAMERFSERGGGKRWGGGGRQ